MVAPTTSNQNSAFQPFSFNRSNRQSTPRPKWAISPAQLPPRIGSGNASHIDGLDAGLNTAEYFAVGFDLHMLALRPNWRQVSASKLNFIPLKPRVPAFFGNAETDQHLALHSTIQQINGRANQPGKGMRFTALFSLYYFDQRALRERTANHGSARSGALPVSRT
jgi:hypothetical protein